MLISIIQEKIDSLHIGWSEIKANAFVDGVLEPVKT